MTEHKNKWEEGVVGLSASCTIWNMVHSPAEGIKYFTVVCDGIIGGKISCAGIEGLIVLLRSNTSTYFSLRTTDKTAATYHFTRTISIWYYNQWSPTHIIITEDWLLLASQLVTSTGSTCYTVINCTEIISIERMYKHLSESKCAYTDTYAYVWKRFKWLIKEFTDRLWWIWHSTFTFHRRQGFLD